MQNISKHFYKKYSEVYENGQFQVPNWWTVKPNCDPYKSQTSRTGRLASVQAVQLFSGVQEHTEYTQL